MNRPLFSSCLLVILTLSHAGPSWSQLNIAPANPAVPETESMAHVPVKVPIRLYWGYLVVVEGSIGNVQKLNFLVDTGAYPSVIDQKIVHRLGLAEQPGRVNLSNKSVQTRLVALPSLLLGPIRAESLRVLTEDLSFFQKTVGHKVDGIVGLDVLRKCSFTINYRTKEMLFGPVESLTFSAPFDTDTPLVTIRMGFENRQLRLVVDTGDPDLVLFQSRLPETTGLQTLGTEEVTDVSGTFQRRKVRIPEVYLGKEPIGAQVGFVVDDRKDDGDNFDGVLGIKGPQFWKIALDFEHRRLSWERSAVVPAISVAIYNDVQLSHASIGRRPR
jgi:predicted aspartyl protease